MVSKTFIIASIVCIYLTQISSCETIDDVIKQYDPSVQKQVKIVSSKIQQDLKRYLAFKKQLDQKFTNSINAIASNLFQMEANVTESLKNDKSQNSNYCLDNFFHELDNIDINLKDCYPSAEIIHFLKEKTLLEHLRAKIAGVFDECKNIYPQQEQVADFSDCIKTSKASNDVLFDNISMDTNGNLEEAESLTSLCISLSETSTLMSGLNIVTDLYQCLEKPAPEFSSVEQS